MIGVGSRVKWAGVQDPRCAPGFNGHVEKISYRDENSLRVYWDERGTYTWERRANLAIATEDPPAAMLSLVPA